MLFRSEDLEVAQKQKLLLDSCHPETGSVVEPKPEP